ncbi:uncharacterized protein LOC134542082 isoform X2 [Bacillus rossius redtenbacheri]|uniref:uncharacterized protein LOC134542082 isoform X2 n=1 Tax=Bacillus rossius redtenbacheri TaxID=93214 RepID=UPI002FDE21E6
MLLKDSQNEKKTKVVGCKKIVGAMKLTLGTLSAPRVHRRAGKGAAASKRAPTSQQPRVLPAPRDLDRPSVDPCENSNDSGLGFDQHQEFTLRTRNVKFSSQEAQWLLDHSEAKRKKLDIKLECDDVNDNFCFPEALSSKRRVMPDSAGVLQAEGGMYPCPMPARPEPTAARSQDRPAGRGAGALGSPASRRLAAGGSATLTSHLGHVSRNRKVYLQIMSQPEQQHRARYQTEGSRGAVKDRSGNGFPVIKLVGYDKPTTLQVFIGTDVGRVAPHMFYQACRVSGKNSTPCLEKKIDGTVVIEVNFDPVKEMVITCDCVGILKERNVDVEHRFPEHSTSRNKKKSTRCRMVFRTTITHPDGSNEVLQILSQPIACTQPPGVPEVCKRSLTSCVCTGGAELFILGKNFLKDTVVVFDQPDFEPPWRETVQPDKEFLQQTHLVCLVPPYRRCDIAEPVSVRLTVVSSGKTSEPHPFLYTPGGLSKQPVLLPERLQQCGAALSTRIVAPGMEMSHIYPKPPLALCVPDAQAKASTSSAGADNLPSAYVPLEASQGGLEKQAVNTHIMWQSSPVNVSKSEDRNIKDREAKRLHMMKMTPPPLLPLMPRRLSMVDSEVIHLKTEVPDGHYSPDELKVIDLRMKPPTLVQPLMTVSDLSSSQAPSMATLRHLVGENGGSSLPAQSGQSVEKFLQRLENKQSGVAQEDQKGVFPMVSVQESQITVKPDEPGQPPVSLLPDSFQPHPAATQSTLLNSLMAPSMPVMFPSETSGANTLMVEQASKSLMLDITKTEVSNIVETSLINSSVNSESGSLSIGTCHINQTPLLPAPHTTSLDVLVSSAIETHVQAQATSTEKLDAFVNSTVESHLMNATPVNSDATLHDQNFASSSARDGQTLSLNMLNMVPSGPSPTGGNFQLGGLEPNPQSSQAALLTNVVTSALDEHLLATTKPIIPDSPQVATTSTDDSNMNTVLLQNSPHPPNTLLSQAVTVSEPTVISSNPRTSPIALKNMILNTAAASLEAVPTGPSRTSPIAIKAMILDSHMKAMDRQMMMTAESQEVLGTSGNISTLLSTDAKPEPNTLAVSQPPDLPQRSPVIQPGDSASRSLLDNIFDVTTTTQSYAASSSSIGTFAASTVTRMAEKALDSRSSGPLIGSAPESKLATPAPTLLQQNVCVSSVAVPVTSIPAKCVPPATSGQKKSEEGEVPQELTQMSENDLLSYINPSCFDQV